MNPPTPSGGAIMGFGSTQPAGTPGPNRAQRRAAERARRRQQRKGQRAWDRQQEENQA